VQSVVPMLRGAGSLTLKELASRDCDEQSAQPKDVIDEHAQLFCRQPRPRAKAAWVAGIRHRA